MLEKNKEIYQLRKHALISTLSRQGLSRFEAKQKAILILARNAMDLDNNQRNNFD
jgi:hypothetical protein